MSRIYISQSLKSDKDFNLESLTDDSQTPTEDLPYKIDFSQDTLFTREYIGRLPNRGEEKSGRVVIGKSEITRDKKGDYRFSLDFVYLDDKMPVIMGTGRFCRTGGFAEEFNIHFDRRGLENFLRIKGYEVNLPEEYQELQSELDGIKRIATERAKKRKHKVDVNPQRTTGKVKSIVNKMKRLFFETALRQYGEEWLQTFDEKIIRYIEEDGRPLSEGGNGCGPFLVNRRGAEEAGETYF